MRDGRTIEIILKRSKGEEKLSSLLNFLLDKETKIKYQASRCRTGLIGNPVKIGSGPAAVTPPFPDRKRNSFSPVCHCFVTAKWEGR
jgi:hypothetical protein